MSSVTVKDYLETLDKHRLIDLILDWDDEERRLILERNRVAYQILVNGSERLREDGFYDDGDLNYYRGFSDLLGREFGIDTGDDGSQIDDAGPVAIVHGYMNGYQWRWHYDGFEVKADDSSLIRSWRLTEEEYDENDYWIIEATHSVFGKHYRLATIEEVQHFMGAE